MTAAQGAQMTAGTGHTTAEVVDHTMAEAEALGGELKEYCNTASVLW